MNATQRKYAQERLQQIYRLKQRALSKKFDENVVALSGEQKIKELCAGRFTINKRHSDHYRWEEAIIFHKEVKRDNVAFMKASQALEKKREELSDKIMLASGDEALKLLASFERAGV